MSNDTLRHCDQCVYAEYFGQTEEHRLCLCHRYPPAVNTGTTLRDHDSCWFPVVTAVSWCGEFKRKKAART